MKQNDVGWMAGILDGEGAVVLVRASTIRKSDGRRSISSRVYMAVTDFEILAKYTRLLTEWGIDYTYTTMKYQVDDGDWMPKVNVNISKQDAVIKLLQIVLPYLTCKKDRAQLILDYTLWRKEHSDKLRFRYGTIDKSLQDEEQTYWERYREVFAGRGLKLNAGRKRDLREAVLKPSTPIYFPKILT